MAEVRTLARIDIRFESVAKVRAREEIAMRTAKSVLNQSLRARRLSDACIEFAKLGFPRDGPHGRPRRLPAARSARISRSVSPASWQSRITAARSARAGV